MMESTLPNRLCDQLYLTPFRRDDVDQWVRLLSNPAVVQNLRVIPVPYTRQDGLDYANYLENEVITHPKRARLKFTIREKVDDKAIGKIDVMERGDDEWELGYWLGEEYWGRGIMTWACPQVLEAARREGIKKITATPKQGNRASRRVLEKNGFKFVKSDNHFFSTDGKTHDVAVYEVDLTE